MAKLATKVWPSRWQSSSGGPRPWHWQGCNSHPGGLVGVVRGAPPGTVGPSNPTWPQCRRSALPGGGLAPTGALQALGVVGGPDPGSHWLPTQANPQLPPAPGSPSNGSLGPTLEASLVVRQKWDFHPPHPTCQDVVSYAGNIN